MDTFFDPDRRPGPTDGSPPAFGGPDALETDTTDLGFQVGLFDPVGITSMTRGHISR